MSSNKRFSNCRRTVDVGFVKLSSDCFCGNRVFKMNTELYWHLCCSSSVNLDTVLCNIRRSPSLRFGFLPLFLLAGDVFQWCVYAVITLGTVTLETPNKLAALVTDVPAKRPPTICPLWNSDSKSPILQYFHTNCYLNVMHWHWHYEV